MRIALKCAKCGYIFMDNADDLCLEIDFKEQQITYICHNKDCHYENIIDLKSWQKKQMHSPLPMTQIMRG